MSDETSFDRAGWVKTVRRVVVKIGSSLLTTKGQGLNPKKIDSLAADLSKLRKAGLEVLVVSSGAIVSGLEKLGLKNIIKRK